MADQAKQKLHEVQQELELLNKNIGILCSKIWRDIRDRSSKEAVALLKAKIEAEGKFSSVELLDRVLEEYTALVELNDRDSVAKLKEYRVDIESLKKQNSELKIELVRSQELSEELDRVNESLGGQGVGHSWDDYKSRHSLERVGSLELEVTTLRRELGICRAKERELLRNKESKLAKMTDNTALFKKIQGLVPMFSGEPSPGLQTEVYRFIDGINLAVAGITDKTEFLKMVKQRMQGDAYQLVRLMTFNDEKELIKLIKQTYLKTKSLDAVFREIYMASQKSDEDLRQYARRLQNLANMATAILDENYPGTQDTVMKTELAKKVRTAFIAGLKDQLLRSRLLASQSTDLEGLLKEAVMAQATLWRGEEPPIGNICFAEQNTDETATLPALIAAINKLVKISEDRNPAKGNENIDRRDRETTRVPPCSFCNKQGHTRENCWQRQNTPYCNRCEVYGHDRGGACAQGRSEVALNNSYSRPQTGGGQTGSNNMSRTYGPRNNNRNNMANQPTSSRVNNTRTNYNSTGQNATTSEYQRNNTTGVSGSQPTAGYQTRQGANLNNRTGSFRCFNCGLEGHVRAECRQSRGLPGNR